MYNDQKRMKCKEIEDVKHKTNDGHLQKERQNSIYAKGRWKYCMSNRFWKKKYDESESPEKDNEMLYMKT